MQLIKEDVKVEWVQLGEGFSGDYNPEDPEDQELLRFDVSLWDEDCRAWREVPDASYCTLFPADATDEEKVKGLNYIMSTIFDAVQDGYTPKRACEHLSYINPDWLFSAYERRLTNHLSDTVAALENVLLHLGKHMTPEDVRGRQQVLAEAKKALA